MKDRLIIGSRGSQLASWQANFIRDHLATFVDMPVELVFIKTAGDKHLDKPMLELDKGMFVKEIERALMEGEIDIAVHSMKDLPTETPVELTIAAICARHDIHDCMVARKGLKFSQLPSGSRVGTSSLRRKAQLRQHRSDLEFVDIRGNVDTRLRKVDEGLYDAVVLAKAGLDRLGWSDRISEVFSTEAMLPAVGQGALGIEARADDETLLRLLQSVDHSPTRAAVMAERAFLKALQGGCQVPIGAWGRVEGHSLMLEGCIISLDGKIVIRDLVEGPVHDGGPQGRQLAEKLLAQGADRILEEVKRYHKV